MARLRKHRIIETLATLIGGGWLLPEFVHRIIVDRYPFAGKNIAVTFVTMLGALLGRGPERPATTSRRFPRHRPQANA